MNSKFILPCGTYYTNKSQTYLSQQLRHHFDLLPSGEQIGQRHPRDACHLHVVDDTHEFVEQSDGQVGVFEAVDGQTASGLIVAVLLWRKS